MAQRILHRYFIPGGKADDEPYKGVPFPALPLSRDLEELLVAANFVEVYLAKEGHGGLVGINYLEKLQLPALPSLYGAMLAGVDFVLMGAGIPHEIPGTLDRLSEGRPARLTIDVKDAERGDESYAHFDPSAYTGGALKRPRFLAIVASAMLAGVLTKKSTGRVDGFVVEGPTAGGHNAPPRGPLRFNSLGEPIYGGRDDVNPKDMVALGLPFWLAGSYGTPERLAEAQRAGARGVQVGTAFAFCDQSNLDADLKQAVLQACCRGDLQVLTDPRASPTGFPYKVVRLEGTLSDAAIYAQRRRVCSKGYLRQAYRLPDGGLGWRCPAEPEADYVRKGGCLDDTHGRKCLCNAFPADIGLGQLVGEGGSEIPLVTSGLDARNLARFVNGDTGCYSYSAIDVINYLLQGVKTA